jgi:hypothetical protein
MLSNNQMNPENTATPKERIITIPLPIEDQNPFILPIEIKPNIKEIAERKKINIIIGTPRSCSYARY